MLIGQNRVLVLTLQFPVLLCQLALSFFAFTFEAFQSLFSDFGNLHGLSDKFRHKGSLANEWLLTAVAHLTRCYSFNFPAERRRFFRLSRTGTERIIKQPRLLLTPLAVYLFQI